MIDIGIDPGLTGACSIHKDGLLAVVFDLPTMPIPDVGPDAMVQNKIDGRALCKLLLLHCGNDEKPKVLIEAVGVMGGKNNAVQTQGSLLRSLGAIEAVFECLGWAPAYVAPQAWKRTFGLIDSNKSGTQAKAAALKVARELYPACKDINLAKHHNRAEAILVGRWLMRGFS